MSFKDRLVLSLRINDPSQPVTLPNSSPTPQPIVEDSKQKKHRYELQREIVAIAKKSIKPSYRKGYITKDEYKIIMKKVVTKV